MAVVGACGSVALGAWTASVNTPFRRYTHQARYLDGGSTYLTVGSALENGIVAKTYAEALGGLPRLQFVTSLFCFAKGEMCVKRGAWSTIWAPALR